MISNKHCLICNGGMKNATLHWHRDVENGNIWCWCCKCDRGYGILEYCHQAGTPLNEFLKGDFDFVEAKPFEVNPMDFPDWFVPLSDPLAKPGVDYVKSRGLALEGDMYYDMDKEGIVFPYYFEDIYVGAQIRLLKPWIHRDEDGNITDITKITTVPGTRLGLLFYGWNQDKFATNIKGVVVTEGAFNAIAIQQALNTLYGGVINNPWRAISCSGSGATKHHQEAIRELKEEGLKVVLASDSDEAGEKMLKKFHKSDSITHYALTGNPDQDWNDYAKELGPKEFAKFFLKLVKKVHNVES